MNDPQAMKTSLLLRGFQPQTHNPWLISTQLERIWGVGNCPDPFWFQADCPCLFAVVIPKNVFDITSHIPTGDFNPPQFAIDNRWIDNFARRPEDSPDYGYAYGIGRDILVHNPNATDWVILVGDITPPDPANYTPQFVY